nr:hypothetical protein [Tanacetum cinerariifolium]
MPPIVSEVVVAAAAVKEEVVHSILEVHISTHKMMGSVGITGTSEIATSDTPGATYIVDEYNEQGVPSKRQCIRQSDSHNVFGVDDRGSDDSADVGNAVNFAEKHEFTAIHESKIVLDVMTEREMIALRPRPLLPTMLEQCRTYRCLFLSGKWRYSVLIHFTLQASIVVKLPTFKEDVNVPIVSSSDHCMLQADLTCPVGYVHLGACDQTYQHCSSHFWYEEHIKNNPRNARPKYHRCCIGRRVVLRTYRVYPEYIK